MPLFSVETDLNKMFIKKKTNKKKLSWAQRITFTILS